MPYKRVDPVPEQEMEKEESPNETTVFEKFREIWRLGRESGREDIKDKARLATAMAMRMHRKLSESDGYKSSQENCEGFEGLKVEPVLEMDMRRMRYAGHFTVCETCRELWRLGKGLQNKELQLKAREAMFYTKRLHEKLKEFKRERDKDGALF